MSNKNLKFYIGSILNPQSDDACDFFPKGMLVVKGEGKKTKILDVLSLEKGSRKYKEFLRTENTTDFGNSVIMPGFFDMHFHWVQDDVRQMPKDSLLGWLEKYTFPTEMKYGQKKYAQEKAVVFFKKLLGSGTMGGACYSSIHEHAVEAAMENAVGEFVIGNVLMNMNSPKELTQTEEESLSLTKRLIKKFGRRHCFTPRFAITTSPKVMLEGSRMADKAKCFKQTHLSENLQEIEFVLSIYRKLPGFEEISSYTEIYEKTGMLGKRSLMGHGIHLSEKELKLLKKSKTAVIHCPTSNAPIKERGLGSGLFDFKQMERSNIRWALGSDIGGGPFLSMFDVMRSFVDQNKLAGVEGANFTKALYRSTLAGARILGCDDVTGNLDPSKHANFIVVEIKSKKSLQTPEEVLKLLVGQHKSKRENYEKIVKAAYFKGERLKVME
ncbi:MAG TPA: amidohydrolase family protein [Bacteriovoracaceae bacterium]|nr:amidohydrolase family protein [Bacteriovoracaceae bacterium]